MADPALRNDTIRTFLTPISLVVSALAIGASVWQANRSDRAAAKADFQLEAARLIMAEPTCEEALARAALLRVLFPERIPDDYPVNVARAFHASARGGVVDWDALPPAATPVTCPQE